MLPLIIMTAGLSSCTAWAQPLVDAALTAHPGVAILAVHATPQGSTQNQIVASNIGRVGKKADADDLRIIRTGRAKYEFNKTGTRYSVEEPLFSSSGNILGALGVSFPYARGANLAEDRLIAQEIQVFFARHDPKGMCAG